MAWRKTKAKAHHIVLQQIRVLIGQDLQRQTARMRTCCNKIDGMDRSGWRVEARTAMTSRVRYWVSESWLTNRPSVWATRITFCHKNCPELLNPAPISAPRLTSSFLCLPIFAPIVTTATSSSTKSCTSSSATPPTPANSHSLTSTS